MQATTYSREFNDARKAQGFKSQEQLDAFYAHYDHVTACAECNGLDGYVLLNDGWQGTKGECAEAKRLYRIYFAL